MEDRPESSEPVEVEPALEWEKPTVTEFDVSSTTTASFAGTGADNVIYS